MTLRGKIWLVWWRFRPTSSQSFDAYSFIMNLYISETEYAARNLIELIWQERAEYENLLSQAGELESRSQFMFKIYNDREWNDDWDEFQTLGYWYRGAEAGTKAQELKSQADELNAKMSIHDVSIRGLSGALLQIAKQGISVVHNGLQHCPAGRSIGSESLSNVIWQARNQSLHYEEGSFRQPVIDCFMNLEQGFGSDFSLASNSGKNLAYRVVELLDWKTYDNYQSDMMSLLP